MSDIELGALAHGPHAELIRAVAAKCYADERIQAIWVGGSLAAGTGDAWSDVDFRIAVEPAEVERWVEPDWAYYLPLAPVGSLLLRFAEGVLLHHMILADGTIFDFYVQDTASENFEPHLVILACRNARFGEKLAGFTRPADSLAQEIDGAAVRQFIVDYWIATHKDLKVLARKYDHTSFAGLYIERMALLRGWYMHMVGKDIGTRVTIHMLGALHRGLAGKLTEQQHNILGMPSRTPAETVAAIAAIRAEMARVGRALAESHDFAYPYALEEVVTRMWNENAAPLAKR